MDLVKWFFPDEIPDQLLYLGEENTLLLSRSRDGRWREVHRLPFGLSGLTGITALPGFRKGPLGLSVNPNPFVFNLFNFDAPLPLSARKRQELIEWRLQRVFPDASEDMIRTHRIYRRRTVLSTLISREILRTIEDHLGGLGHPVSFIGCSTEAAISRTAALGRQPVMILEQEGQLMMVLLVQGGVPLFVRKIRFTQEQELKQALHKTVAFVKDQQGAVISSYIKSPLSGQVMAWLDDFTEMHALRLPNRVDPLTLFLP